MTLVRPQGGQETHEVAATLSPEGARVFRIDGRVRSAAQVKVRMHASMGSGQCAAAQMGGSRARSEACMC